MRKKLDETDSIPQVCLSENASDAILSVMNIENESIISENSQTRLCKLNDKNNIPTVPPIAHPLLEIQRFREALPAHNFRGDILRAINENQVIVISGETGMEINEICLLSFAFI